MHMQVVGGIVTGVLKGVKFIVVTAGRPCVFGGILELLHCLDVQLPVCWGAVADPITYFPSLRCSCLRESCLRS